MIFVPELEDINYFRLHLKAAFGVDASDEKLKEFFEKNQHFARDFGYTEGDDGDEAFLRCICDLYQWKLGKDVSDHPNFLTVEQFAMICDRLEQDGFTKVEVPPQIQRKITARN